MDPEARSKIMKGQLCPEEPNVQFSIKLQSDTHGFNIQSIVVPVVRGPKSSSDKTEKLPPLKVAQNKIYADGRLTLTFNSEVLWPSI